MEWVAIDIDIAGDPIVHRIADALRVRVAEVVGLLTLTFGGMAKHAPDGNIAAVPDTLLETWATWHGKRGALAQQIRAELCDEDGTVRAWEHYNGRNIRRAKAASERARSWRENAHRMRTERVQNANGTHNRTHSVRRTVQDSTGQDLTAKSKEPKGAAEPRAPKAKGEAAPWMGLMRQAWSIGTLPIGSAKLLSPVVGEIGADECAARLANYCEQADPEWASVRNFVTRHAHYATVGRPAVDPVTGLPNAIGIAALTGRRA